MFSFWNSFKKGTPISIGEQLKIARNAQELSIGDVAKATYLREADLIALEENTRLMSHELGGIGDPGYERLIAIRYAKYLGFSLADIQTSLPHPAALKPKGRKLAKRRPCTWSRVSRWV